MKIKFLGTGMPVPNVNRCGQGILISHDNTNLLFDCGPGVNRRLIEADIKHNSINHLFFTHLHWDHFGDYDSFVQTSFVTDRRIPLQVFGPNGIKEITDLLFQKVYYRDLIYRKGIRGPGAWIEPEVNEIFGGVEFNVGPFTIKTFRVHHGEYVDYSFAYRIECEDKSVVISGDTAPVQGFEKFAEECDLLIHEVMPNKPASANMKESLTEEEFVNLMGHSTPRQVGKIAMESNAKKLMLIHLAPNLPNNLIDLLAEEYNGPIEISKDLLEVEINREVKIG